MHLCALNEETYFSKGRSWEIQVKRKILIPNWISQKNWLGPLLDHTNKRVQSIKNVMLNTRLLDVPQEFHELQWMRNEKRKDSCKSASFKKMFVLLHQIRQGCCIKLLIEAIEITLQNPSIQKKSNATYKRETPIP